MKTRHYPRRRVLSPTLLALCLLVLGLSPGVAVAESREPLKVQEIPEFYQRVLTLPGAALTKEPGGGAGKALPIFSVLYVYDRKNASGADWLEVGAKSSGGGDGWIPADKAQDWRSMLVMQYAPRAKRERVLMFNDKAQLQKIVEAADGPDAARRLLADVAAKKSDPSLVVAIEPEKPVDYGKKPYVMPIIDWKADEFADGTRTLLVQVASANAKNPEPPGKAELAGFKVAIVFVLDTTISMQPYIDRVREAITHMYEGLQEDKTLASVSFGIVAFRNSLQSDKRIEYVTRVFQKLDPATDPKTLLANLAQVKEATVRTPGWNEDAFAGMYDALNTLDWEPYHLRVLVPVSDAGALAGNDKLASRPGVDVDNIVELANRKRVSVFPVYLRTPQGDAHPKERETAEKQYLALGTRTIDPAVNKYTPIEAGSVEQFGKAISAFVAMIRTVVRDSAQSQMVQKPPSAAPGDSAANMTQALINEVFRSQIEYVGSMTGTTAPPFFKAWASDRDLVAPNAQLRSLDVKVFLTRNQLNGLAQSLKHITDSAKQASLAPGTFFDLLRSLSATMAGDPNRQTPGSFQNLAESNLLPAYLKALPYKSKVLRMSQEQWSSFAMLEQQQFIDELEYKLKAYHDMYEDVHAWIDFGAGDPGQAVYPVPLDTLP